MNKNDIEVLPVGNTVKLKAGKNATIKAICITGELLDITYNCIWWENGSRHTAWLHTFEMLDVNNVKNTIKIGFNSNGEK